MSHSRIFDEYARIMTERGLFKTAEKKDTDYNVVPDSAGSDTKVDKTGYELTEIAHPEQIQVAESRLNDGIVENGVERQKAMIDVALRNPRGVLADLMKTLVKVANILDQDMSDESLKLAKEVDDFLVSLAQQSQVVLGPEAGKQVDLRRLPRIREAVNYALERLQALDFSTFGFGGDKYAENIVNDAIKKLKTFAELPESVAVTSANPLAQYVNQFYKMVRENIQKSTDWGRDQRRAVEAWDNLKNETDEWLARGRAPEAAPPATKTEAPGVAAKAPEAPAATRHYAVNADEAQVKELQELVGAKVDGKFGKNTFNALMQKASEVSLLNDYLKENPALEKGYEGWNTQNVGEAILRIRQGMGQEKPSQPEETVETKENTELT